MKRLRTITWLLMTASPLVALQVGRAADDMTAAEERYGNCLMTASRSPDKGINEALVWRGEGGGAPARHCEAVGLFNIGEYAESAARLELIAEDMRYGRDMPLKDGKRVVGTSLMLASIWTQAANAWLMADEITRAEAAIDQALSLAPRGTKVERQALTDRARIAAADGDFDLAYTDLKRVTVTDPGDTSALLLLASAARQTERLAEAEQLLEKIAADREADPAYWLELGNLKDAEGDTAAARSAWLKVAQMAPDSGAALAAQRNLERIDLKKK